MWCRKAQGLFRHGLDVDVAVDLGFGLRRKMPQVQDEVQDGLVDRVFELGRGGPVLVRVDHVAVREEELRRLKNSPVLVE
jgi:hypothetical protein